MNFSKLLLIIISIALTLAGVAIVAYSNVLRSILKDYYKIYDDVQYITGAMTVIGFFVIILGCLGICGAIAEVKIFIFVFCAILCATLLLEIALGSFIFIGVGKTDDLVRLAMNKSMVEYNKPGSEEITAAWDIMHKKFRCCGVCSVTNWKNHEFLLADSAPDSCCVVPVRACGTNQTRHPDRHVVYTKGCAFKFVGYLNENMKYLGSLAFAAAIIQILTITIAFQVASKFKTRAA